MTRAVRLCSLAGAGLVILLLPTGCNDEPLADAGTGAPRTDAGSRDAGAGPVDAGALADGWEQAYTEGSAVIRCDAALEAWSALPHVTRGDRTLYVGYRQASGNNQNPIVALFEAGTQRYCVEHETEGPDGRAEGLAWDGGDIAYVVYSIDGGGSSLEGHGGWLASYAPGAISGGGPKVSVVGRIDVADGELNAASFIVSVLSSGRVNTHAPAAAPLVLADGTVEFRGRSAHKPIDSDGRNSMDCTDSPFDTRYRLSSDLAELVCADSLNCTATTPCE